MKKLCALVAAVGAIAAFGGTEEWAKELDESFAMAGKGSLMAPGDLGLVNGHISLCGWVNDPAEVRRLCAPPYFCSDYRLEFRFNGRGGKVTGYTWRPEALVREGEVAGWRLRSALHPIGGERGFVMSLEAENTAATAATLRVSFAAKGTPGYSRNWTFSPPSAAKPDARTKVAFATTFGSADEGVFKDVPAGGKGVAHFVVGIASPEEADALVARAIADPEGTIRRSVGEWRARVRRLASRVPRFESDNEAFVRLYRRSLIHFPLTEWNADDFVIRPFYVTGGLFGACMCSYLWNIGGPYMMWPLVDPEAIKAHLRAFLKLDLRRCYALNPCTGGPVGPYYPINQEKMIFMIRSYVMGSGDVAFLKEMVEGRAIIEHVVAMALVHDDLAKPAVIADYGKAGCSHLELRHGNLYDCEIPDMNLRRIVLLRLADRLCRIAGHDPKVDLVARANALKALCRERFWNAKEGWFCGRCSDGRVTTRWTIQMFKALGWGDWVLDSDADAALRRHLMDETEFLGSHGVHSLSKKDPAYDDWDVDNGGPGACVSFAPAVCDRLYADGHADEAEEILRRLTWLGDGRLPYWCDSHYADRPDYRHNTPLQLNIEGGVPSQTILFGMFGISVGDDFRITVAPHLPKDTDHIVLEDVRLAGRTFTVRCSRKGGVAVTCGAKTLTAPLGGRVVLD